ncbi:hypothetical protein AMS69_18025 [Haloarcula rubripromontorii]|uniref:Uncharacterized protein n=1 Tax=Haloarcula rubripromontorii TaxID=1705562 RepID=A0A0M9AGM4_9EURY|nr:hypothetical protein [Haloarcula rubripromontorii]KOX91619.1 hypothetical protein AMS69_18025 [Haloarcula rubripromontorii]
MNLDEVLDILEGGELKVYETPLGTKLSLKTPTGEDWHFAPEEREAARDLIGRYEDVATLAYDADDDDELARILTEADDDAWRVIGRVENIPASTEEARELVKSND